MTNECPCAGYCENYRESDTVCTNHAGRKPFRLGILTFTIGYFKKSDCRIKMEAEQRAVEDDRREQSWIEKMFNIQ